MLCGGCLAMLACGFRGSPETEETGAPWHCGDGGFRNSHSPYQQGGVLRYWQGRVFGADAWATYDLR